MCQRRGGYHTQTLEFVPFNKLYLSNSILSHPSTSATSERTFLPQIKPDLSLSISRSLPLSSSRKQMMKSRWMFLDLGNSLHQQLRQQIELRAEEAYFSFLTQPFAISGSKCVAFVDSIRRNEANR